MTSMIRDGFTELQTKQQAVWSSGDYNRIAALTVPVNEATIATAAPVPGERLLDVATGTGHSALSAARQGADVVGIDYVPALIEIARKRAAAEQVPAEFIEAAAENLPFPDSSFDVVVSAIGVMFAADHQRAADEIVRVVRPGGRIVVTSWTATGFVGGILATVGRHVSPPPGARPPVLWGDEDYVAERLGSAVASVSSSTAVLTSRFADAEAFADLFLDYYGPTFSAAKRLDEAGREVLKGDLVEHARRHERRVSGGVAIDWEYRIVRAVCG